MCNLFAHHFIKLQSGYPTCIETVHSEKSANDDSAANICSLTAGQSTAIVKTAAYKGYETSDIFMQVHYWLSKVQKEHEW